jgi:regulator of sirC expression with transglutaminase-like and TPR domain
MARPRQAPRDRLARLAGQAELELAGTALLLAGLVRAGDVRAFSGQLDELAAGLAAEGAETRAALLSERLAGFALDTLDEDHSANLMWVLENRRGTPEALGILWLEVAWRAGWPAEGLAFPGPLLVRLSDGQGGRSIIDPVLGGTILAPHELRALLKAGAGLAAELEPGLFAPLSNRDILLRLQNEAKLKALRSGRVAEAVALVEAVLLFAPEQAHLWREAGMMHMRLDNLPAAIAALEQFVARTGNSPAKRRTQLLLQEIRARLR